MASGFPTGTVTLLFSDIEGSTQLMRRLGDDTLYARVLAESQALLRGVWAEYSGVEVDTAGDGFFVAFPSAPQAVMAATGATRALATHLWPEGGALRARIGLHSGAPQLVGDKYVGMDVHRAARIAAAGRGGQVLLSDATEALARDHLPDGVTLRDLGARRLKDLQRPERIYQLVISGLLADFPPLKTLGSHLSNLPLQPTPLLGREETLAAVCALLRRDGVRLITITGPGGIGKTRLSLQVAAELLDDFAGGVWFVRLSQLTDAHPVLQTIADALSLKEAQGRPVAETLREYLGDKRLLLVLDNFEQVVAAAPAVGELLSHSAGLKLLVTSRVALHLRGEHDYPLAPLPLPDPGTPLTAERLSQYAAVALFIERAGEARPDFAVTIANAPAIAEICVRLEGLPLAIELAAARVKLLPPEALLARLSSQLSLLTGGARDLEERQRTMRATIAWSEQSLSLAERTLFRRLAVFFGGATLGSAEAVCLAPDDAPRLDLDLLDGLGALVDESLIQQREEDGEPRFGMLHVIREYGLEQLEAHREVEALRAAHAAYYLALAVQAEPALRGPDQRVWLERLEREHDNLRAALSWFHERGDAARGLRLAVAVMRFWQLRGQLQEADQWLNAMLALGDEPPDRAVWARALVQAGVLAFSRAHDEKTMRIAVAMLERGLEAARAAGETRDMVEARVILSALARYLGDQARGKALFDEALADARESGDSETLLAVVGNIGALFSQFVYGETGQAETLANEAVDIARQLGRPNVEVSVMYIQFLVALQRADSAHAREIAVVGLDLARQRLITYLIPPYVSGFAYLATVAGQHERVARLMGASMALMAKHSGVPSDAEIAAVFGPVYASRAALGEERWAELYAEGEALTMEEAIAEALAEDAEDVEDAARQSDQSGGE